VYQPKDGTKATSAQALQMVEEITTQGWQIPFSTRVDSITNFQNTRAIGEDDLEVRDLVVDAGQTDAEMRAYVEETILNEPLLVGRLLSQDARTGAILVSLRPPRDNPLATNSIVQAARDLRAEMREKYPNIRLELTGSQMLSQSFSEAAQSDLSTLTPLMYLIIAGFLVIATRSTSGTIATVIVIALSAGAAMGFGSWLNIPVSPPVSGAPVIILTVAVADCVHLLITALVTRGNGVEKKQAIIESLSINAQPVFLTSVTTAIGLFSLNFSDAPPYRDLGTLSGFGALFAWVLSMSLFPALLTLMPMNASKSVNTQSRIMGRFADWVILRRKPLLFIMLGVALTSTALLPRFIFNDRFVEYFDERMDFRVASDWASDNLTGIYIINYSLAGDGSGGVSEPSYLEDLDNFGTWLRGQPEVKHVASFADVVKRINRSMNADRQSFYAIPENRELSAQYLLLYEMSLPYGLDLNDQLNVDKSASRMLVTLTDVSTVQMNDLRARAMGWLRENTPEAMHVDPSGQAVMFSYIGRRNFEAMAQGTLVAFLLISACLMLALRSLRLGLISLIPNITPPLVAFGMFSLIQTEVGFWTSFVTATAIGLIVDATVHMLTKYRHARINLHYSAEDSVRYSFATVGTALWVSSVILVTGFMVLTFSPFLINGMLGLLVSMTILAALILDFLLLPPLLIQIDGRLRGDAPSTPTPTPTEAS
jgi:predicted RND superfamily exporter protein